MPATEQTWRSLKLMHFVFGVSALLMLVTTVWMLASDHNREWKKVQNQTQQIDDWMSAATIAQDATPSYEDEREVLEKRLQAARMTHPDENLIKQFVVGALYDKYLASKGGIVSSDDPIKQKYEALLGAGAGPSATHVDSTQLNALYDDLNQAVVDNTDILAAYKALAGLTPAAQPAAGEPVATHTQTPKKEGAAATPQTQATAQSTGAPGSVDAVKAARDRLLRLMNGAIAKIKFVEDDTAFSRKKRRSYYDSVKSELDIAVRDGLSSKQLEEIQQRIDSVLQEINGLTARYEQAVQQRKHLEDLLRSVTRSEDQAKKNLEDFEAKIKKLEAVLHEHTDWSNTLVHSIQEMPILDGFSPRLRIEQIWLPKLTLNNNFRDVARFDRCITCHQEIDKTAAGSAVDPAFPRAAPGPLVVELPTPASRPDEARLEGKGSKEEQFNAATQQMYGLRIAAAGMLNPSDVTIEVVWPRTPAARAGLMRGDVITHMRPGTTEDLKVTSRGQVLNYLVTDARWGKPIALTVRRGMPHPFASHPRLDLFVGSMSPHKMQSMGCTICHQGQGSATAFKWASHTPNSLRQEAEWEKEYGYVHNHHWIYPMYPDRFIESSCLKCHHQVVDLLPSPRFPEPPAPKVVAGYKLITQVGCFGCHEIAGFDGPKSIGPDLRAEPMYYAAGAALTLEAPARAAEFAALLEQAQGEKKQADARLAELQKSLADWKKKAEASKSAADAKELAALKKQVAELESAAGLAAQNTTVFQQSLSDIRSIEQMARTLADHPEDTPVRLRLFESLTIDAARSGAPEKLLTDPVLSPEMLILAQEVVSQPSNMAARRSLIAALQKARETGEPPLRKDSLDLESSLGRPPVLSAAAQKLVDQVKTVEGPGTFRKVGPSLRHVAGKLGPGTLNRWIYNPRSIRESTKMPRFFGLHAGLTEDARRTASLYEPIEARAIAQYLVDHSRPLENLPAPAGQMEPPSAERGKLLFQTRGCLACHKQSDTPQAESTFGPDLTGLGKKLVTEKGAKWVVDWLRDPKRYHLRTAMPNLLLEPLPLVGEDGKAQRTAQGAARMTDPPADIAAYLLGSDWAAADDPFLTFTDASGAGADEPKLKLEELDAKLADFLKKWLPEKSDAERKELAAKGIPADIAQKLPGHAKRLSRGKDNQPLQLDEATKREIARRMALDTLVAEYLMTAFPVSKSREYLEKGIPEDMKSTLKGAEVELIGPIDDTKKLNYVGRRAIGKFGCTGCHDVPGFESARPIGTGLADWGRKETSKLAFEHILAFLPKEQAARLVAQQEKGAQHPEHGEAAKGEAPAAHEQSHLNPEAWKADGFFVEALMHEQREGFLWQKLRQPRSFDYEKTENKSYNEWLRMPQFNLTETEREQIMTFVLGLVAEPPAAQYVYQPDARHAAMIRGEKSLATFNCQGCHVLENGQWRVAFLPGAIEPTSDASLPPFLRHHATPEERRVSQNIDRQGLLAGTITGMLKIDKAGNPELSRLIKPDADSEAEFVPLTDLEGQTISPTVPWGYGVELWQPSVLNGSVIYPKDPFPTLSTALTPKNPLIVQQFPPRGGDFARLLLPIAIATQKQGEGADAWAWVPPPLTVQGRKTQEKWLHDFLLDPLPIRPGVILRMPKFNMSSDESETLVQYFVARDNAEYPNLYGSPNTTQRLAAEETSYQKELRTEGQRGTRFGDAEKILISQAGCIKCHLVGDFTPDGSDRALAPNLANVYRRLKPDYVRRWIAKPSLILPYTKMPINFPYDPHNPAQDGFWEQNPATKQSVQPYHGDSLQQIEAVTDLLSNWDRFMESQTSVRKQIQAAGSTAPAPAPAQQQ